MIPKFEILSGRKFRFHIPSTISVIILTIDVKKGCPFCTHNKQALDFARGREAVTMKHAWEYCRKNPDRLVGFMHSLGTRLSYTPAATTDMARKFLSRGVLSTQCARLPKTCNVCSSHFSPLNFPHTPGNMWLARCSYVGKLMPPRHHNVLMDAMAARYTKLSKIHLLS